MYVPSRMSRQGITPLHVTHTHALCVSTLPVHHRDPFDRLLVAQALVERIPILTADPVFDVPADAPLITMENGPRSGGGALKPQETGRTALLDVNVLVALAWPNQVHHQPAREWLRGRPSGGASLTPIVVAVWSRPRLPWLKLPPGLSPQSPRGGASWPGARSR